jgi:stage II sporulation protein AA (anti-sigma F factor antagonist)
MKDLKIDLSGACLTVQPAGELDHHTVKDIRLICDPEIMKNKPRVIVLDFSHVTFMDTSGIGLILGRRNTAERIGARVVLRGLSPRFLRMVELSGVLHLGGISLDKSGGDEK